MIFWDFVAKKIAAWCRALFAGVFAFFVAFLDGKSW